METEIRSVMDSVGLTDKPKVDPDRIKADFSVQQRTGDNRIQTDHSGSLDEGKLWLYHDPGIEDGFFPYRRRYGQRRRDISV